MSSIMKSATVASLYSALAKAQSQIGVASKDKVNPAFGSRYVDLSSVLAAVLPAWNAHGLAVSQFPFVGEGNEWIELTTLVSHASGEFLEHSMRMPVGGKRDAHAVGSATTYARRYSVAAIAGVIQDDDDGNMASHMDIARAEARNAARPPAPVAAPAAPAPPPKPAPAPAAPPVQAPAPEEPAAPAPATKPATKPAPAPEPEPEIKGEIEDQPADPPNGLGSLNEHQLTFSIKVRSKGEMNYPLFVEWALATGRGVPTDWALSKQKQALEWIEKGGWQAVRRWQAARDAGKAAAAAAEIEAAADKLRVEAEVNESEEAQLDAKPKRKRRTKAEMEAYRASLAAGGQADVGGEE